jgi:hypothetical protein
MRGDNRAFIIDRFWHSVKNEDPDGFINSGKFNGLFKNP